MKWRLSKDKNDAELAKKSMPCKTNEKKNSGNPVSPSSLITQTPVLHNNRINSGARGNDAIGRHSYRRRFSVEDAMKNNSEKQDSNPGIYVMTSNQLTRAEPWMTSTSAQMTKTARGPANHSNLSSTMLDNYTSETNNDFHYINPTRNPSNTGSIIQNGSTAKLIPATDDQSTKQTKCSIFRGLLLCLCLNITYANIVRFPRELERHGCAFLVPYLVFILLVGLPIILLEVSIGQFLGQGAANSWKVSPIMKGACVIGRIASCLGAVWVSLEAVLGLVYIIMFTYKTVPFSECIRGVRISGDRYSRTTLSGVSCLEETFLKPVWDDTFFFALLASGLAIIWIISVLCAHNSKTFRRSILVFGLFGFGVLIALTGWEVDKSLRTNYFPEMWIFNETLFADSTIWFDALVQVLFGTYIGVGALPVMTGKFLYKGDAIRTSVVYMCLNLLINALAVILFMVQFDNNVSRNSTALPELKALTAVYDNVLDEDGLLETRIMPGLMYGLIVISAIVTVTTAVYSVSKLMPRYANYILGLIALFLSILALLCPEYMIARVLDSRIVGTLVIIALVFDIIATAWIYGAKNIYLDLEFAIGRSILKGWLVLWCIAPAILTGVLLWWCVGYDQSDILNKYIPRWAPIVVAVAIILIASCVEISKQVDYNFFGMICEAAKTAKEWGPADPLARHAWKQWRSVCQDTGRKDFTLRRRGTRDYTHSIKRGQYSTNKYGINNWKNSTTGTSSPNYSGSMFGDSAIEEDLSVGKYSGVNHQFVTNCADSSSVKPMRYSSRSRQIRDKPTYISPDKNHKEIVYVRRLSSDSNNKTTITITPTSAIVSYPSEQSRGPTTTTINSQTDPHHDTDSDHICWRKFSINSEEYSTEL